MELTVDGKIHEGPLSTKPENTAAIAWVLRDDSASPGGNMLQASPVAAPALVHVDGVAIRSSPTACRPISKAKSTTIKRPWHTRCIGTPCRAALDRASGRPSALLHVRTVMWPQPFAG